jgi:hypothetical protein
LEPFFLLASFLLETASTVSLAAVMEEAPVPEIGGVGFAASREENGADVASSSVACHH